MARDVGIALPSGSGTFVGRIWDPSRGGPVVVVWRDGVFTDLSPTVSTVSELFERADLPRLVAKPAGREWAADALAGSPDPEQPHLLAPVDLQVIKACGVTFARSLLERVVEASAGGDPTRAAEVRAGVERAVGTGLSRIVPGSREADALAEALRDAGLWSPYLEVGIGPDPEVFTKAPVLSAVGTGAAVGILESSVWNNPEPEIVLVVSSRGIPVGATLGNDVTLRDVEGRSPLLLGQAKDNNASTAIGPLVRLFDDGFGLAELRRCVVTLEVIGLDGFHLREDCRVAEMSRGFEELVAAVIGAHHRYPDGFALFTGTPFAPTTDRAARGGGFTHRVGDVVRISSPELGTLENVVAFAHEAPPWESGIAALMAHIARLESARSPVSHGAGAAS